MKQKFLRFWLTALVMLVTTASYAYTACIDGIYYNFRSNSAYVTYATSDYNSYSGDVVIPASVIYNGVEYPVTEIGSSAFYKSADLTSITIPNSVTSIASSAFYQCSSLTKVDLPESLSSIGSSAFEECTNLTNVVLPNTITSLGSSAFKGCSKMATLELSKSLSSINSYTFQNCSSLKYAIIPEGITSIGRSAFEDCTNIKYVVIPSSIKSMDYYAFRNLSAIVCCQATTPPTIGDDRVFTNTVHIPAGTLDEYKKTSYWNKYSIKDDFLLEQDMNGYVVLATSETEAEVRPFGITNNVTIPSVVQGHTITSIPSSSFGHSNIEHLTLPNTITSIGSGAFSGCTFLRSINIPGSVETIASSTFNGCNNLETVDLAPGLSKISSYAFYDCSSLKSINIPSTVSSIEYNAFQNCVNLETVVLNEGLASVGSSAFYNCKSLKTITIPNTLEALNTSMFSGCISLTTVELPKTLSSLPSNIFENCESLKNLVLPSGLLTINSNAFSNCSSLEDVAIPKFCTSISVSAFSGCTSLKAFSVDDNNANYATLEGVLTNKAQTSVLAYPSAKGSTYVIPGTITSIGEYAFSGSEIVQITIPTNVNSVGRYAFQKCAKLKGVTIEDNSSSLSMGVEVFYNSGLESIYLGRTLSSNYYGANSQFYNLTSLKSAELGSNYTQVYASMFYGCTNLESIKLSENIKTINSSAFYNCANLKSITIPSTVTSIGDQFLSGCSGLQYINSKMTSPMSLQNTAFTSVDKVNCRLIVPAESVETYAETPGWMTFLDIVGENDGSLRCVTITNNEGGVTTIGERSFSTPNEIYKWYASSTDDLVLTFAPEDYNTVGKLLVNDVDVTNSIVEGRYTIPAGTSDLNIVIEYKFNALDAYENVLYIADAKGYTGTTLTIPVRLQNTANITNFQFDLTLPEGVTIAKDGDGEDDIQLATERTTMARHTLSWSEYEGATRIVCTSLKNYTFTGNDGDVVYVTLNIAEDMEAGEYPIVLSNIEMSEPNMTSYNVMRYTSKLNVANFIVGDVNGDKKVTVTDVTGVVNLILGTNTEGLNQAAADVNKDNKVTVTDATGVVNIILGVSYSQRRAQRINDNGAICILPFNVEPGQKVEVPIILNSSADEFSSMQFDVILPAGLHLIGVESDNRHLADFAELSDNAERVVSLSLKNAAYAGNGMVALTLVLEADETIAEGKITLNNIELVRSDLSSVLQSDFSASYGISIATGVSSTTCDGETSVYDLQGRNVRNHGKGVYVVNGHKVVK